MKTQESWLPCKECLQLLFLLHHLPLKCLSFPGAHLLGRAPAPAHPRDLPSISERSFLLSPPPVILCNPTTALLIRCFSAALIT